MFINQPEANAQTETEGNAHFAGSRILLGKTMCYGEVGHCAVPLGRQKFDVRVRPAMKLIKIYMNITRTLQNPAVVETDASRTVVTFVVLDQDANPLPVNSVKWTVSR